MAHPRAALGCSALTGRAARIARVPAAPAPRAGAGRAAGGSRAAMPGDLGCSAGCACPSTARLGAAGPRRTRGVTPGGCWQRCRAGGLRSGPGTAVPRSRARSQGMPAARSPPATRPTGAARWSGPHPRGCLGLRGWRMPWEETAPGQKELGGGVGAAGEQAALEPSRREREQEEDKRLEREPGEGRLQLSHSSRPCPQLGLAFGHQRQGRMVTCPWHTCAGSASRIPTARVGRAPCKPTAAWQSPRPRPAGPGMQHTGGTAGGGRACGTRGHGRWRPAAVPAGRVFGVAAELLQAPPPWSAASGSRYLILGCASEGGAWPCPALGSHPEGRARGPTWRGA